jgi:predicted outer membrane protein
MKTTALSTFALAGLLLGAMAAAGQSTPPPPPISQLSSLEESFVANLMQQFVVEAKAASAARNRGSKSEIRDLGVALGNDYPKMAEDLSIFAAKKSIVLSADLEASHQRVVDALSSVSVDEFDSAYLALAVDDQTRFLVQIQPILNASNDPELRLLLSKIATRISDNLARTKAVQNKFAGVSINADASVPK